MERYFVESNTGIRQELDRIQYGNMVYDWVYEWIEDNLGDESELGSEFYDWAEDLHAEIEEAARTRGGFELGEETLFIDSASCAFCDMEDNGDIPDDRKDLFEIETEMLDSKVWLTGRICHSRLAIILGGEHQQMLYREVKINFCPVCGRKLPGYMSGRKLPVKEVTR